MPKGHTKLKMALWRSWLARRPVTAEVAGSSPVRVAFISVGLHVWPFSHSGSIGSIAVVEARIYSPSIVVFLLHKWVVGKLYRKLPVDG